MASSSSEHEYCLRFSLAEIKLATETFSEKYQIGKGGFGKVYQCFLEISGRPTSVAVKRLSEGSKQGLVEFKMEIETLGKIRHRNIVSLIGYCKEEGKEKEEDEMILVYEHIQNHTLHHHLKLSMDGIPSLTWEQRLEILIGAGRGLDHLHSCFIGNSNIVHRDIKSSNILLDEKLVAKVSDLGLAKLLGVDESHVSTRVKYSTGYVDPYYFNNGILSEESDTYSFGVVLLEVLTGKLAIDESPAKDKKTCHSVWASKTKPEDIKDPNVSGYMSKESLLLCHDVVQGCLAKDPGERPSMTHVVAQLQSALKQLNRRPVVMQSLSGSPQEDDHNHLQEAEDVIENNQSHVDNMLQPIHIPEFALADINLITDNFSDKFLIAEVSRGGSVFHGVLTESGKHVAIKKLDKELSDHEFIAQVSRVSSLKHKNVVELVGYCLDGDLRVLVYEFAPGGSLRDILHGPYPALSWLQRLKIAVGIATGLCHIHDKNLVHHNIKSTNVLLFYNVIAKITDLHPSTQRSCDEHQCLPLRSDYHPTEFGWNGHTRKDDVYNFGIILLQLLTGRKICQGENLVRWATPRLSKDKVQMIVDARLIVIGGYHLREVAQMATVAAKCIGEIADMRPNMNDVLSDLKIILERSKRHLLTQELRKISKDFKYPKWKK